MNYNSDQKYFNQGVLFRYPGNPTRFYNIISNEQR